MPYSTRHTILTIVEQSKVNNVVNTIRESAKLEKGIAGIIVISAVEDILTI